jgi:hypothetical protein
MKNIATTVFAFVLAFNLISCKSENKSVTKEPTIETEPKKSATAFNVANADTDIKFTAYKTTDKIGVGGTFRKIDITNGGEGNTLKEAINDTEFSIPVSSLATKDSSRDYKIKKFFFGIMDNTKLLSGKLQLVDDANGIANITMNGETKPVPFVYTIQRNEFNMKATIDINNWNASKALASLNKVCEDLHKGADGVSKTWSEVDLNITTTF